MNLIDFDPRPDNRRFVSTEVLNEFLSDLQRNSAKNPESSDVSMWETSLEHAYEDYIVSSEWIQVLKSKRSAERESYSYRNTSNARNTRSKHFRAVVQYMLLEANCFKLQRCLSYRLAFERE